MELLYFISFNLIFLALARAAFYKDLKYLCLECSCDPDQLLGWKDNITRTHLFIDNLVVRCEEQLSKTHQPTLLGQRFLVLADTLVSPETEIQTVDLLMNNLNLTSLEPLHLFTKTGIEFRNISLESNQLREINDEDFADLQYLELLNLSKNNITRLGNSSLSDVISLRFLFLQDNELNRIDLNAFEDCPLIEEINLRNNKINQVHCETLKLLKLTRIDLSSNFLYSESLCDSTSEFPQLSYLNLSNNQIDLVSESTFAGMPRLRVLDLSGNRLVSFSFDALGRLDWLEGLFLEKNRIRSVFVFSVDPTPDSLIEVNMAHNEIEGVTGYGSDARGMQRLYKTANLTKLDMSHNRLISLTSLEPLLGTSSNLQELDVSWNSINSMNRSEVLGNLKKLILDGNPLMPSALDLSGFKSLNNLGLSFIPDFDTFFVASIASVFDEKQPNGCAVFNMSHNPELKTIVGTFKDKQLCQIDLSENQLTSAEESMFNWDELKWIDLQGNPFDCQCSLKWMVDFLVPFLMNISSHLLLDLSCKTPEEYKNRRFVHWYRHSEDFCRLNPAGDSDSGLGLLKSTGDATPRPASGGVDTSSDGSNDRSNSIEFKLSGMIIDHKMAIAAAIVAAIIGVMIAIGCVLLRKHKTRRRRKEHIKRNRIYENRSIF